MRTFGNRNTTKDWARLALKAGLVLTAPKVWDALSEHLSGRVDDARSELNRRYEDVRESASDRFDDASSRLSAAKAALQGRSGMSPVSGFLIGAGVGVGLGILFAPASGSETREILRDKAFQARDKATESVSSVTDRIRQAVPATGTSGD